MASKSLGTLTIDLIAKVGGFVSGMDKAERSSEKWRKKIEQDVKSASAALAGVAVAAGAAAAGVAASGIALLKSTSAQITESDRWAKSLGISTQSLLEWQYAAEQAGLSGDNIADIFKDLNDKIGDAVLNKSGEAAQALDTLGLSAAKLAKLSPDKQLLAITAAMRGMGVAQKTNILESLGNDLSKMLPLFDDGNKKLNQFINQARDFGVAPSQEDIDKLTKVNSIFQEIEGSWQGFKNKMASGLADIDLGPLVDSVHQLEKTFTDPKVLQGIANITTGVAKLVGVLGDAAKLANDMAYGWGKTAATGNDSSLNDLLEKRKELNDSLAYSETFLGKIDAAAGVIRSSKEIQSEIEKNENLIRTFSKRNALPTGLATVATGSGVSLSPGEHNQKVTAKKSPVDNAFKSTEMAYQRQIELIDTTGKKVNVVTEQQKLQFDIADGKLKGLNETQKKRLESLAQEVDRLNAVKKANEENLKVAEFVENLRASNQNAKSSLNIDISGGWLGEQEQERMKESLNIQAEFLSKQSDLQKQYQSGDITKSLYDKETDALNDALKERLKIQEEHYKKVDELQNDGTAGFVSGLATQIESSMNLYSSMQQVGAQTFSNLTDMIVEWAETGKLNAKDFASTFIQSVGAAMLQYAAAQVAMAALNAYANWIGVPYVGPAIAPAQAIAAAAAAGVFMTAIGSALQGQAHDGIDSVPETGTWLLQKGERVTTAKTSAKLDATLDRVASQSNAGGGNYSPNITIPINGNPSDATIDLVSKAAREGALEGYNMGVRSIVEGKGDLHRALMAKTNAGRKVR